MKNKHFRHCVFINYNYFCENMITMSENINASKVQTAFRLDARLLDRVKKAAKQLNISVNEYVCSQLREATKDIRTDKEMEEERKRNDILEMKVNQLMEALEKEKNFKPKPFISTSNNIINIISNYIDNN